MDRPDFEQRLSLGARLRALRQTAASAATEAFLQAHPDWLARYGDRARTAGVEDGAFHVDFLAGAIESGSPEAFAEYARWTSRVLASRGISAANSAEFLGLVGAELARSLARGELAAVEEFVAAGRSACLEFPRSISVPSGALAQTRKVFLQSLRAGQRHASLGVVREALRDGHTIPDLYAEVVQEALYEIGRLWETGAITVAEEHLATAIAQSVVTQLYAQLPRPASVRGRMVVAGVQGELHQVGAQMVADVLESDGWDVRFLGTHMPHPGILDALAAHDAAALGLSATMLFNVAPLVRLVRQARERFPSRSLRVVVGGGAFRDAPELWREIGVDGYAADVRGARVLMRGLGA